MIATGESAPYVVLAATTLVLIWIAVKDLLSFSISNNFVLLLVALYGIFAIVTQDWQAAGWHVLFAAAMFALLLLCYAQKLMGGGDVKLLAVAFLWTGAHCALAFLIAMLAFAVVHTFLAKRKWVRAQYADDRMRLPFAPSICAGLIVVFLSGCLTHSGPLLPNAFWQFFYQLHY
jgi:prepilin peptidase CpaA